MSSFADGGVTRRWIVGGRVVMAAVVAGNLVGLAGNVAAAVRFERAADFYFAASADLAANNSASADQNDLLAKDQRSSGLYIVSVQMFCEVAVLLLIIAAFAVVGIACSRRVANALSILENSGSEMAAGMRMRKNAVDAAIDLGRKMRRKGVRATLFVFVTLLLRSAHSTFIAVAFKMQDISNSCPSDEFDARGFCSSSCHNAYTHIVFWWLWTPSVQLMTVLVSKPLPLLVALWGMTTHRLRRQMQADQVELAKTGH
jgi:hypothetical protein